MKDNMKNVNENNNSDSNGKKYLKIILTVVSILVLASLITICFNNLFN